MLSFVLAAAGLPPASAQTPARFARPELLVDATWLAANLNAPERPGRGHAARAATPRATFPGAVWLDNNDIRVPKRPPTFLPTPQEFVALMARLGISNQTRVVAYDERGGIYAARLWWILNHYGHANVALLDGGWTKWTADKRETSTAVPSPPATTFAVRAGTVGVATADDVKAAINSTGGQAHRCPHAERDRRQGPARHQARRLHRVVDSRLLGRHPGSAAAHLQVPRRDRRGVAGQGRDQRRQRAGLLPGGHAGQP